MFPPFSIANVSYITFSYRYDAPPETVPLHVAAWAEPVCDLALQQAKAYAPDELHLSGVARSSKGQINGGFDGRYSEIIGTFIV